MNLFKVFTTVILSAALAAAASSASAEKQGKPQMKCADHFTEMDTNKDGKLGLAEFKASGHPCNPEQMFKERDANRDGYLTRDELCAGAGQGKCPYNGRQDDQGGDKAEKFKAMDADKDGKLTLKEYLSVKHHSDNPEKKFNKKDDNGDGVLTMDEYLKRKSKKPAR